MSHPTDKKVGSDEKKTVIKPKASGKWLKSIYDTKLISVDELLTIYESLRYVGFDRDQMLLKLEEKCGQPKLAIELIIGCSMRGPQAMSKIKLSNGKTPSEMGIPGSGKNGTNEISCQRISAATADVAAYYLKVLDYPKRIPSLSCPGWLQFPSAGSIRLPESLRQQHVEFSMKFSSLIGGVFNEQIYQQMVMNAYYDEDLHLFD